MQQANPTAPATTPTATSPVSWTNLGSLVLASPALLDDLLKIDLPILTPDVRHWMLAAALILRVVLPYLQRRSTVQAVQAVEAQTAQAKQDTAKVARVVANHVDPLLTTNDRATATALREVAAGTKSGATTVDDLGLSGGGGG